MSKTARLTHEFLKKLKLKHTTLSLVFVSDPAMKRLNQKYLRHAWVTDVLAFPFAKPFLGEIIIAPRQAKINATRFGVSFKEELSRCIVHGILHLQGYSDDSKTQRKRMRKAEDVLLKPLASQIRTIV
ncbi:MAG: rRNA maturation RNase YbeY [Candidatus Omnitrophica bacterium]|nr:rRNA maturation RNase YbeY [Candidatus Omnitrophota bacterium]